MYLYSKSQEGEIQFPTSQKRKNFYLFMEVTKMAKNQGAIRSKKLLTQAFFDLLKENPNRRIQIKELCSRAGVARPTFYAHYQRIEDIPWNYYSDHFLETLSSQIESSLEKKYPINELYLSITEWSFEYWGNQLERYLSLINAGMESVIFDLFREGTKLYIEKSGIARKENPDPIFLESYASHVANKMHTVINLWVKTGMEKSPEQMAKIAIFLGSPDDFEKIINLYNEND